MNNEIKDFIDETARQEKAPRKIKFKSVSFTNIGKRMDQFRISRLEKKLVNAKKNALDTELPAADMKNDAEVAQQVLLYRSKVIAKLEAKINFLETGNYVSTQMVKSRAIKLKDLMMKNLEKNVYGAFSISDAKKGEIFENQGVNVESESEKALKEEAEKLNNKLKTIEETEDSNKEDTQQQVNNVSVEETKKVVEDSFTEQSQNISVEDVSNVVENELKNDEVVDGKYGLNKQQIIQDGQIKPIENTSVVEIPKIAPVVVQNEKLSGLNEDIFGRGNKDEVQEIKVSSTEAESKVDDEPKSEEPVEENGVREVPVVAPERKENVDYLEKTKEGIDKLDDLYEKLGTVSINDNDAQEKIHEEINKVEDEIIANKEKLTDKELAELEAMSSEKTDSEAKKEENIGFDYSDTTIADMSKAIDGVKSTTELSAILDRVRILKKEEARTQERVSQAKKEDEEKNIIYKETMEKLIKYGNDLTEKCNRNLEVENEIKNKSKEKEEAINSMLKAMENKPVNNQQKKK